MEPPRIDWNFNQDDELQFQHESKAFLFAKSQPISAIAKSGFIVYRDGVELADSTLVGLGFKPNRTILVADPSYKKPSNLPETNNTSNNTSNQNTNNLTKEPDVSRDELYARAIQTIMIRNEEPTEEAIEKEIQQMVTDELIAYEIQLTESGRRRQKSKQGNATTDSKTNVVETKSQSVNTDTLSAGLETFFNDVEKGIKTTYQSLTEFVEAKYELEDIKQESDQAQRIPPKNGEGERLLDLSDSSESIQLDSLESHLDEDKVFREQK